MQWPPHNGGWYWVQYFRHISYNALLSLSKTPRVHFSPQERHHSLHHVLNSGYSPGPVALLLRFTLPVMLKHFLTPISGLLYSPLTRYQSSSTPALCRGSPGDPSCPSQVPQWYSWIQRPPDLLTCFCPRPFRCHYWFSRAHWLEAANISLAMSVPCYPVIPQCCVLV